MKKKPSSNLDILNDSYEGMCYKKALEFLHNKRSDEEYINIHNDSGKRNTLAWPELIKLREDMDLYRKYLLKFSLLKRRLVLMNEEIIGFSQQALYEKYGISFNPIARFIGKKRSGPRAKAKPKIRNIETNVDFNKEFIAFIALLSRVPIDWLEEEIPSEKWCENYFRYLPGSRMKENEFLEILASCSSQKSHDVRGIILETEDSEDIFIRLESMNGGFIIELFNKDSPYKDILYLLDLVKEFDIKTGSMQTVIPTQVNFTIISQNSPLKIINPPEFCLLQL
ncbi:hypothetical protein [Guptibacillus spartinae]|uniref:hypothetical protein n=1 Tax=Guptibacillus spartinae TaxID=3025679 RepID=UPI00235FA970|nr:hypothetical protein [Pseudalkalibacillus spartinae]